LSGNFTDSKKSISFSQFITSKIIMVFYPITFVLCNSIIFKKKNMNHSDIIIIGAHCQVCGLPFVTQEP
jgi:hypothetical protein